MWSAPIPAANPHADSRKDKVCISVVFQPATKLDAGEYAGQTERQRKVVLDDDNDARDRYGNISRLSIIDWSSPLRRRVLI